MNITIHAGNIAVSRSVRKLVEKRLRFAFRRYGDHLQKVIVRLSSEGNPSDIRCQLQARIPGHADVVIDHTDRNIHAAIYRSIERASVTIIRRLKRQRNKIRQVPQLAIAAS